MDHTAQEVTLVNNPLARLWIGKATVYEYKEVIDGITFQSTHELVPIVEKEPCRLSHKQEPTVNISDGTPSITQTIVLFIRPDLEIKEGSVIEVTQHFVTNKYKRASKPAIYTDHQEVALELYEDKA